MVLINDSMNPQLFFAVPVRSVQVDVPTTEANGYTHISDTHPPGEGAIVGRPTQLCLARLEKT